MSSCNDRRFEQKLYAYELGMLSNDERREVELHLLDCDSCNAKVRDFEAAAILLRHDKSVHSELDNLAQFEIDAASEAEKSEQRRKESKTRSTSVSWTRVAVVVAALVVLLLVRPWRIEFYSRDELVAAENRLMILPFDVADPRDREERLGEMVADLLITDLSESEYVQVLSRQRTNELSQLIGKDAFELPDIDAVRTLSQQGRVRWFIQGTVFRDRDSTVISSQLVDAANGGVIASQQIAGDREESIFTLVDRLTVQIKKDLALPDDAFTEPDPRVIDVTTYSPVAYRFYLEGLEQASKLYTNEAIAAFENALKFDSNFAMVYYHLSDLKDRLLIQKAAQLIDRTSKREQYYIQARLAAYNGDLEGAIQSLENLVSRYPDEKAAYYQLGAYYEDQQLFSKAIECLNQSIALDPLHKASYNRLAYLYDRLGKFDQALRVVDKYIEIAPDEPNPYDSKGQICAWNGQLETAIEAYRKALEIRPDYTFSLMYLSYMYTYHGNYDSATVLMRRFASLPSPQIRSAGRLYQAYVHLYAGRLRQALQVLNEGIAADTMEHDFSIIDQNYILKGIVLSTLNDCDGAIKELQHLKEIPGSLHSSRTAQFEVQLLAQCGEINTAVRKADSLRQTLVDNNQPLTNYWYARASIDLASGNLDSSIHYFQLAARDTKDFPCHYWLARALWETGQYSEVVEILKATLSRYSSERLFHSIWSMEAEYYLGRAYEETGQIQEAVSAYEHLLSLRKNPDTPIAILDDAKERLERLQKIL
ncbi:MAG: tetratricopeptide repeat protein [candidate division Zixibacteria bacterium]|nr:tetratricopeptide repeat protein [candidate division Zixibacteria bacterium]